MGTAKLHAKTPRSSATACSFGFGTSPHVRVHENTIIPEAQVEELVEATEGNAVPADGKCVNQGDFAVGNHCVKLTGQKLKTFQEQTNQNFGESAMSGHGQWCVCLHLYASTHIGGGDTSQCSAG